MKAASASGSATCEYYNCDSDDTGGTTPAGASRYPDHRVAAGGTSTPSIARSTATATRAAPSAAPAHTPSAAPAPAAAPPWPLSLGEAKIYLDAHKAADSAGACRQKFVILLTDGSDTYACGASGAECASDRYKNRREPVARAKALADAGYRVFVVGFGSTMPPYLQNTLNWMAYYGGTDNPNAANAGSTAGYSIVTGCNVSTNPVTNPTACCNMATNPTACFPSGVTSCAADSAAVTAGLL